MSIHPWHWASDSFKSLGTLTRGPWALLVGAIFLSSAPSPKAHAQDSETGATHAQETVENVGTETKFGPWVRLMEGQSMSQWEGDEAYFRIEDECIVAGTLEKKIPHNQFLCTKKQYGDFELVLEAKLVGQGDNAGVQFRSQRIPNTTEVSGFQADIGSAWNRSVWGALYDESRRRKMLAEPDKELGEKLVRKGDWNELRVLCIGNKIQIFVNGKQTVDYREKDPAIPDRGVFALQIHSGAPTEAWYRNIRVREVADAHSSVPRGN